jgi:hypothetical protein
MQLKRSTDITLPFFFLWGLLKEKGYMTTLRTSDNIKEIIHQKIAAILAELLTVHICQLCALHPVVHGHREQLLSAPNVMECSYKGTKVCTHNI